MIKLAAVQTPNYKVFVLQKYFGQVIKEVHLGAHLCILIIPGHYL